MQAGADVGSLAKLHLKMSGRWSAVLPRAALCLRPSTEWLHIQHSRRGTLRALRPPLNA